MSIAESSQNIEVIDGQQCSPLEPPLPRADSERLLWGSLHGCASALAIASAARSRDSLVLVVTADARSASQLEEELKFFLGSGSPPVLVFPDWETLPYDVFSPLPEIVSQRLSTLHRLREVKRGVLVVPAATLLQKIAPREYLDAHTLSLDVGDTLDLDRMRQRLERAGYQCVSQVVSHGELAVRGAILDIFPMGHDRPYRIDLFDDEVETIRLFDPETQRSTDKVERIRVLPARELPTDDTGIERFRQAFRAAFDGDPRHSLIYREVTAGRSPGGLEYYLPLFFARTDSLFDYLPEKTLVVQLEDVRDAADTFLGQVAERYEQRRYDPERPLLPPDVLYLTGEEMASALKSRPMVLVERTELSSHRRGFSRALNFASKPLPPLGLRARATRPAGALQDFVGDAAGRRILFLAESAGRREMLMGHLKDFGIRVTPTQDWQHFLSSDSPMGLAIAPLEQGMLLDRAGLAVITETQLYGERVRQERRRRAAQVDSDQIVRNLTELHVGAPVVHEDHGVGRFQGLTKLTAGGMEMEFLTLEYARGDKLYVPVSSLHLISRYAGASPETAPLHRLGGDQWEKLKRKAAQQVRDVAAELLDIYARRAANQGYAFPEASQEYADFAASFEFEETPDQQQTIESVLADMRSPQPMDRVVCGDVGFGKTEVAMRAAFVATQAGKQVAVLVPTTLLAQQHYQNFSDRFVDWPITVASLSRFGAGKQQQQVIAGLASGSVDIVIGTHKLLQPNIRFKNLGLVIVDEEHRFGVRDKERLKSLRSEVDLVTLTATPIPRTLNMAMTGMRDLSIIATPPAERHPIKTFVSEWNDALVVEACQREMRRGGQVYFLHNEVSSIEQAARRLEGLLPGVRAAIAHGQMRERALEQVMRDFYHQRLDILVCTTIVESGIDVPSANTIIINRADKLGLAQLHQLRGRVGRSHHRAYAYLITPPARTMTADARKRLEAIEALEDLGAGFTLATHDLEIRGAGELLGAEQSGQIQEIGFTLYMDLLERAVQALKAGRQPQLDRPLDHGTEIDLKIPALLPDDYLPDVHARLVLYKRIASASTQQELRELQVEMIDRFGLLPLPAKNLMAITELKLKTTALGILKLEAGPSGGRIVFGPEPDIDPARLVSLIQTRPRELKLDGSDKLRFIADLSAAEQRLEKVTAVIDLVSGS